MSTVLGRLRALTLPRHSLQGRIGASVGSALLLILGLFILITLWALHQGTEEAFQSRVTLASVLAIHVDESLDYLGDVLESETGSLILQTGDLSEDHRARLAGLRRLTGPSVSLSLVTTTGTVLWHECADPCSGGSPTAIRLERVEELAPRRRRVSDQTRGTSIFARVEVPLADDSDRVTGVLVAEIDPRHPSLVLLPQHDAERGVEFALITADGRFIAGSESPNARIPGGAQRAAREHARITAETQDAHRAGYRVHEQAPGLLTSGHVVAYAPLPSHPSWKVTVEQPVDRVLQLPRQIQWYLAAFSGVTLALVMALAFLDVRRITAPIHRLTTVAERLAAGRFDEPVGVSGADELGQLARAFESMRVQLRDSIERERNVAVLEERERIAAEMHDGLGQVLGYVIMKSLAVAQLIDSGDVTAARTQIDQLEAAAREAYADVRENILALRTTLAPGRGLISALREYAAGFERQSGIAVELITPLQEEESWMEPTAEVQLLRIVQEALTNVRKHAEAHRVTVWLAIASDLVHLEVVDDGRGFDPSHATDTGAPHFGLQMMRERAEGVGGSFAIGPAADGGTRVAVALPRPRRGAADGPATHTPR